MVEKDLYNIVGRSVEGDTMLFTIEINSNHEVLKGHFPSMPVMPGVCLLLIIKQLSMSVIGMPLSYSRIKECKFISAILPDKCNVVDIKMSVSKEDNDSYKLISEVVCEGKIAVKLKASMGIVL